MKLNTATFFPLDYWIKCNATEQETSLSILIRAYAVRSSGGNERSDAREELCSLVTMISTKRTAFLSPSDLHAYLQH
jgi:hypothetical protein